jgi:DNA-binding MarR family transcriptional regulator
MAAHDATTADYSDRQVVRAMIAALEFMHRLWFAGRFRGDANHYLPPLLVSTYLWSKVGRPMSITEAFDAMQVAHGATAKRYIDMAEKEGLIKKGEDKAGGDGRRTLLLPTPKLEAEIRQEAARIADRFRNAVGAIASDEPLPETGADQFDLRSRGPQNPYLAIEKALPELAAGWTSLGSAFLVLDRAAPHESGGAGRERRKPQRS